MVFQASFFSERSLLIVATKPPVGHPKWWLKVRIVTVSGNPTKSLKFTQVSEKKICPDRNVTFFQILGGGNSKIFMFTPKLGEDSQIDEHIFQRGGSTTN